MGLLGTIDNNKIEGLWVGMDRFKLYKKECEKLYPSPPQEFVGIGLEIKSRAICVQKKMELYNKQNKPSSTFVFTKPFEAKICIERKSNTNNTDGKSWWGNNPQVQNLFSSSIMASPCTKYKTFNFNVGDKVSYESYVEPKSVSIAIKKEGQWITIPKSVLRLESDTETPTTETKQATPTLKEVTPFFTPQRVMMIGAFIVGVGLTYIIVKNQK